MNTIDFLNKAHPSLTSNNAADLTFSQGQLNLSKVFQNDADTAMITKILMKTFLDFFCQCR